MQLSSGRYYIKRYAHRISISFVWYVAKKELTISSTSLIRGTNLRKSRSRIYRINVSSSTRVNWYRPLYISPIEIQPFIRAIMIVRNTSYIFTMRRIDIIEFIQRVSIARLILASLELTGILRGRRKLQSRLKVVVMVKSGPWNWLARVMYNHVKVKYIYLDFKRFIWVYYNQYKFVHDLILDLIEDILLFWYSFKSFIVLYKFYN